MSDSPVLDLETGEYQAPAGKLVAAVTWLEMTSQPALADLQAPEGLVLEKAASVDIARYRSIHEKVGGSHLWFSALARSDEENRAKLEDPNAHLYFAVADGSDAGFVVLQQSGEGRCEVAYFGLAPEWTGKKAGPWMMAEALKIAWGLPGTRTVWLHTCSFDHPRALAFYQRMGFQPYRMGVEIFDDPRNSGILPEDAAPQIPRMRND